jgi:hypothetical protein
MVPLYQNCYNGTMPDDIEKQFSPAELPPMPETGKETAHEVRPRVEQSPVAETFTGAPIAARVVLPVAEPVAPSDPTIRSIELILSEDMTEHFKAMSPDDQAKFKAKGEETVSKIVTLMQKTALKAKEVLKLVVGWLRFIPHVNKYFLEQESKIKTDKIMELYKREHGE